MVYDTSIFKPYAMKFLYMSNTTPVICECDFWVGSSNLDPSYKTTEGCAKAIVASACRGDLYLTEPSWMKVMFWMKIMCPEVLEWCLHSTFVKRCQTSKDS